MNPVVNSAISASTLNTDMICLTVFLLWGFAINMLASVGRLKTMGTKWGISNRDENCAGVPAWVVRTENAFRNHMENAPLAIGFILVVQLAHRADDVSAWASIVFLAARIAHSLIYIAGITVVRTLAYYVSMFALFALVSRIFS